MKPPLKTASTATINLVKRAGLWLQIRNLETLIDGQGKALDGIACPMTAHRITLARSNARRQLARLRAEYSATFPPGVRFVWTMA